MVLEVRDCRRNGGNLTVKLKSGSATTAISTGLICNEVTRGLVTSCKRETKAQLRKTLLTSIGPITFPFLVNGDARI